jgi:aminoglycoside phosphotransferase (APT) family kinase protein
MTQHDATGNDAPESDATGQPATGNDALDEFGTPWRRDAAELGVALTKWAEHALGRPASVTDVGAPGNGMSSETVLFTLHTDGEEPQAYAARLAPLPELYPVFQRYDLDMQARCMRLVRAHTDVPAPVVRWVELDSRWLGGPFLVMPRIEGDAPPDIPPYVFGGWVADASPEQRAGMQRDAVSVLARLHTLNPGNVDLEFLARPEHGTSALDQQLGHERQYYEWARDGESFPLIERAFAWLDEHRPPDGDAVLNWGDARIGNMLFRDFRVAGVLDWEMATVGPREVDLAWMIFLHRFFQDMAERYGMTGIPDFMTRDGVVADYEELTGHRVRDLDWFEVFAALRFAIVSVRTTTRGVAYGTQERPADNDDFVMFRHLLDEMISR